MAADPEHDEAARAGHVARPLTGPGPAAEGGTSRTRTTADGVVSMAVTGPAGAVEARLAGPVLLIGYHRRKPPGYDADAGARTEHCPLLGGPCYPEPGTGAARLRKAWVAAGQDDAVIWEHLEEGYGQMTRDLLRQADASPQRAPAATAAAGTGMPAESGSGGISMESAALGFPAFPAATVQASTTDRAEAHAWLSDSGLHPADAGGLLLAAERSPGREQVRVPFAHRVTFTLAHSTPAGFQRNTYTVTCPLGRTGAGDPARRPRRQDQSATAAAGHRAAR